MNRSLPIVPQPASVRFDGDDFLVASISLRCDPLFLTQLGAFRDDLEDAFGASILAPGSGIEEAAHAASHVREGSDRWGANFRPASAPAATLTLGLDESLGVLAYTMELSPGRLTLSAAGAEGAASALAALSRLLFSGWDGWRFLLPRCRIDDEPAFSWRGIMIDSARHYQSLSSLKRMVRLAGLFGLNRLHWHLTDDQGWRLELLSLPGLAARGGRRGGEDPNRDGRYSQAEIAELVAYAAARGVSVMPEVDLPGHAVAALAAYPSLGCTGGPYEVAAGWGIFDDVLCLGSERTMAMVMDVFDELSGLFTAPWVHLGGDECPTIRWESCPRCSALKGKLGLGSYRDLQGWFVGEVSRRLAERGKYAFGWDEVLDSSLENGAGVFHWRAWEGGKAAEALSRGRDLVRSPSFPYYLDYVQGERRGDVPGVDHGAPGAATLRRIYEWDPAEGLGADAMGSAAAAVADGGLPPGYRGRDPLDGALRRKRDGTASAQEPSRGRLLGVQANVWTEFIRDERRLEYMVFPRLLAVAETAWAGERRRGWEDFERRLVPQLGALDLLGVNYCRAGLGPGPS